MAIRGYAHLDADTNSLLIEESNGPFLANTTRSINLKTTGQTTLYTVPSIGGTAVFVPTSIILMITNANTVTVPAIITVGISSALTSLLTSTTLTAFVVPGKMVDLMTAQALQPKSAVPQGGIIQLDVTTGATATTLEATIAVFGYFVTP